MLERNVSSAAPRPIKGLLLDLDDTLVDTKAAFGQCMAELARVFLPAVTDVAERDEQILHMWRTDSNGYFRAYTRGELSYHQQRRARANQIQEAFGGEKLNAGTYAAWSEVFDTVFQRSWAHKTGVIEFLETAQAGGILLGVVTNAAAEVQLAKLSQTGLAPYFATVVTLDDFQVGKPDPRVFHKACADLGLEPAVCAYIGDEADVDAVGACRAGLTGLWFDDQGRAAEVLSGEVTSGIWTQLHGKEIGYLDRLSDAWQLICPL